MPKKKVRVKPDIAATRSIEDEIRDVLNWIAVFKTEYDLPAEVVSQLKKRLESIAVKVGRLECR